MSSRCSQRVAKWEGILGVVGAEMWSGYPCSVYETDNYSVMSLRSLFLICNSGDSRGLTNLSGLLHTAKNTRQTLEE